MAGDCAQKSVSLIGSQNSLVEAFIRKIVVSKDGFDWYLRLDESNLDGPLRCTVEGKRKSNAKVSSLSVSPSFANSTTGSYKGLMENFFKFAQFTLTLEEAQEYAYSISPTKRVRNWRDIEVNLYI